MFTFKAQEKSNAKRFLVKTCKIDEAQLDQYLTQVMGKWGTYIDAEGKPLPHAAVEVFGATEAPTAPLSNVVSISTKLTQEDIQAMADASMDAPEGNDEEEPEAPAPSADAFSNFALNQLTAASNTQTTEQSTQRESTTASGLKIERNRPSQNGITRPSQGTVCLAVWLLAEEMSADLGRTVPLSAVVTAAKASGINQYTARTQYACWRKFNGITGHLAK